MYHPYFRGKQFELLCVREMAPVFKQADFRPIIEPVRDVLSGLSRALDAVVEVDGRAIVIVNPYHGDLSDSGAPLTDLLREKYLDLPQIAAGVLLKQDTSVAEAIRCYRDHASHSPVLVHAGFGDAKTLAERLGKPSKDQCHVFLEEYSGKLYQKHFNGAHRILLRDWGMSFLDPEIYPKIYPNQIRDAMIPGGTGWYFGLMEIKSLMEVRSAVGPGESGMWWPGTGLNRRRRPFQGRALPLSYLASVETCSCIFLGGFRHSLRIVPQKVGDSTCRAMQQLDPVYQSSISAAKRDTANPSRSIDRRHTPLEI
jgi:hypothetical protein